MHISDSCEDKYKNDKDKLARMGKEAALKAGKYRYEWFNPSDGTIASTGTIEAKDGGQSFEAPFRGDAVLFLAGGGE